MFRRTMALFLVMTCFILPININAGDELKSVSEYTELFNSVMNIVLETTIYDEVDQKVLFEAAMAGMFNAVDDYSDLMTIEASDAFENSIETEYVGIGVQLEERGNSITIVKVFAGSPALAVGVLAGDVIVSVDGVDTTAYTMDQLLEVLLGEAGTKVDLGVRRGVDTLVFSINRASIVIPTVESLALPDTVAGEVSSEVGYIAINSFGLQTGDLFIAEAKKALEKGAKYLILDLRDNSGGYTIPAIEIAQYLVPAGKVITFVDAKGVEKTDYSQVVNPPFEKIITLTNEYSASSSEILASALQDSEISIVVGENTFGKGISQYYYQIDEDYYIKITGQEFISRNGNKIHEVGITPDLEIVVPDYLTSEYRLYKGEDKDQVLKLEMVLDYLGYPIGKIDTLYDDETRDAVKKFQGDQGLFPYGVCDYTTLRTLNEALLNSIQADDRQLAGALEWLEDYREQ